MSCLILFPTPIGEKDISFFTSSYYSSYLEKIEVVIAEKIPTIRRFWVKVGWKHRINEVTWIEYHKKNKSILSKEFEELVHKFSVIGLFSEAGVPCVADPGNELVLMAHSLDIKVLPLIGPSSILQALMASGLNGQSFSFLGYLPVHKEKRRQKIQAICNVAIKEKKTQIFIETPYRNQQLFKDILIYGNPNLFLTIAFDIMGEKQMIRTLPIAEWRKMRVALDKRPCVFLLG